MVNVANQAANAASADKSRMTDVPMRVSEFAGAMNVSADSVLRWIKRGVVHAFRVGAHWRIPRSELVRVMGETFVVSETR